MELDNVNLKIPTLEEEVENLKTLVPDSFYKDEGSIFDDVFKAVAQRNIAIYNMAANVLKSVFLISAEGQALDNKALEFGLARKPGQKAVGTVTITGDENVAIPHDTIVMCDSLQYTTDIDVVIPSGGSIDVPITAYEDGLTYNVGANRINRLGIPIPGVKTVLNAAQLIGGADIENDRELRDRLLDKIQHPVTSGNAYEYKQWALSIPGIGSVRVFPTWNGANTVKVIVIGADGQQVGSGKVKEVSDYIESVRPIGATVTVKSASPKLINISVRVKREALTNLATIKETLKIKLREYLNSSNLNSNEIKYSKISNVIENLPAIRDFDNLTLNNETTSIILQDEEIGVLGEVTVNE